MAVLYHLSTGIDGLMMNRVVKPISQATNFGKQFTRQLTLEPLISARKSVFPEKAHCPRKSVESET